MPPLVTAKAFAEREVAAVNAVSRQARSGEARRGMAIEPFARKDVRGDNTRAARDTFGLLRDCFPLP